MLKTVLAEDFILKSDISTIGFILLFTFIFAFCFNSCDIQSADYFSYTSSPFSAQADGEIGGEEVEATVSFYPDADADSPRTTVCFQKPESLRGITVSLFPDGTSSARLGSIVTDEIDVGEMVAPFAAICESGEVKSIQKQGDGTISVTVEKNGEDLTYGFESGNGLPSFIDGMLDGRSVHLRVRSLESK